MVHVMLGTASIIILHSNIYLCFAPVRWIYHNLNCKMIQLKLPQKEAVSISIL